jgi:hypothetical protein
MKIILTERQLGVLIGEQKNTSDPSTYPACVSRYVKGGGFLAQKVGEISTTKTGQQYITIFEFPNYQFYNTGRVQKPDGKMTSYSCGTNKADIIVDGVNLTQQKWQKEKGKYSTNYEKQERQKSENLLNNLDPHTVLTIMQIGTAFIPMAGPFISAGIGALDAALYYKEGDKSSAALVGVFSLLPVVGSVVSKIPGVKQLGTKGMAALANKISFGGKNLSKAEVEIANSVQKFQKHVQEELTKLAPKLKSIIKDVEMYKPNFVKKYGEVEYNFALANFLYDTSPKARANFVNKLKSVKTPNIQVKRALGGRDHRVFQSKINPNVVFKAEVRPGEVSKWYDTFKKYPNVFAKTIKKTKVRDTDGTLLDAVAMEKLDTLKFEKFWDSLEKVYNSFPKHETSTLEYLVKHIKEPQYNKKFIEVLNSAKKQTPSMKSKIDEFMNMVNQLYKITPEPDIRKFNLGYDGSGVLKALDI